MKNISVLQTFALVAALIVALFAVPVRAEETTEDKGLSLMEEGMLLFFEGLQQEMEPAMDGLRSWMDEAEPALRDFALQMGPALNDLMDQVDDWSAYHPPEVLPNGDIIIRRKAEEPAAGETDI